MPEWLAPLLNWSYWFSSYPSAFTGLYFKLIVGTALGSFIAGLAIKVGAKLVKDPSTRKLLKKLGTLALTFGVLMAISFFFTQTSTPTLGSRFWFGIWVIMAVVWLGFILKYAIAVAPKERQERTKQLINKKYLPGR